MNPPSIKVHFVREIAPDLPSRAVMLKDGTNYSHVLLLFPDLENLFPVSTKADEKVDYPGEKIFHATGDGVHIANPTEYYKEHILVREFVLPLKVPLIALLWFIDGAQGKGYGFDQIAAVAVNSIARNGHEKYICSELVGYLTQKACGVPMEHKGDRDVWKPNHCYQALSAFLP